MTSYAEQIRAARHSSGLTQAEVAARADVSVRTVKRIEKGVTAPSLPLAKRITDALDVSLDSLFVHEPEGLTPSDGHGKPHEPDTAAVGGSAGLAHDGG